MQSPLRPARPLKEHAGYFPVSGAHLYTVLNEVIDPVARVLLVGPFASERHNSYLPWVRWARFLAAEQIEVLRYDYRGIGESTGAFEHMTFADWQQDVEQLAAWLEARSPQAPLVLHGLGLGAVLAGRAFDAGAGAGLLLWSPPQNANQALRATLMRWAGLEQIFKFGDDRKSASDYIRELEHGSPLEVDGYRWSPALWRDSFHVTMPQALASEEAAAGAYRRPVRIVKLTREAAPLTKGGIVGYDDLKDFNWLFAPNRQWITTHLTGAASQSTNGSPIHEALEDRELMVLEHMGVRMRGTMHRPADCPAGASAPHRPGVLFLNSLSLPRAASGDSAVHWAASIAAKGYPALRIDLPGLGDSEGSSSTDLLDFINGGGFTAAATTAMEQLVDRHNLSGTVLFGHCAGSVSAVYAAAAGKHCKGLVLLDPYFHLPQAKRPKVREGLSDWARRSAVGGLLSNIYDRAKKLLLLMRGSQPPGNANTELLARWKQLALTGVPILLLKAPGIKAQGAKPRLGEFDYIDYVVKLAGRKSRVTVEFVEAADHSFANREGRAAVQMHIDRWLATHFPLAQVIAVQTAAAPVRAENNNTNANDSNRVQATEVCALEGR